MSAVKPLTSIGFIMDGNRRWAVSNSMKKHEGHKHGLDKFMEVIEWCKEEDLEHVVVYAMSTENWKRPMEEVAVLTGLLEKMLIEKKDELIEKEVRIRLVGDRTKFSSKIQALMGEIEEQTSGFTKTVWVCVSYGGRAEMVAGVKQMLQEGVIPEEVTEQSIEQHLWTSELPDPQLVIRTGGDHRLSNFLLWKAAYSELFFTPTHWPAFSKEELSNILNQYRTQSRVNMGE